MKSPTFLRALSERKLLSLRQVQNREKEEKVGEGFCVLEMRDIVNGFYRLHLNTRLRKTLF